VRETTGAAARGVRPGGGAGPLNIYEHVDPSHSIRYIGRTRERAQRAGEGGDLSEITKAIEARQTQIAQLQSDIEILQGATSIVGGGTRAPAKAASQPKAKPKAQAPQPKGQRKRKPWSAAAKKAMSKRIKASWAKRKRTRR